jgi:inorganic triphosphatase YgiF
MTRKLPENTEVELKLLVDPGDIAALRRHPLVKSLARGTPRTRRLFSIYFDTGDFLLRRHGVALRVRKDGRRWIQTVKGSGEAMAGLHRRAEWESGVAGPRPDFTKLAALPAGDLLSSREVRDRLCPLFTTTFGRTAWLLESPEGDRLEMALDVGEVRAEKARLPICEVELELKAGSPAFLYEIALALQETLPLRTENASKAERGYALCSPPAPPAPVKAAPLLLSPGLTVGEALRAAIWNCIDHLQANQAGFVRAGGAYDPEYVHQMRVAVRRLRSVLGVFSAIAPGIRDAPLLAELRWLAERLGAARDWDVFLAETLAPVAAALSDAEPVARLVREGNRLCQVRRAEAREAAASQRYYRLLLTLGAWIYREPWRRGLTEPQSAVLDGPVSVPASEILERRHRRLRRRGRNLADLPAGERHAVRIAAKKLRYAAEFFAGLYPGKRSGRYIKALAALQGELGFLNDQVAARRLLAELGGSRPGPRRARALGAVAGWMACRQSCHLARLPRAWEHFRRQAVFWNEPAAKSR